MALRTTQTTRGEHGTRLPAAKSFYDKVKPRPALGSIQNTQQVRQPTEKVAMKSKLPSGLVKPVVVRSSEPQEHVPVKENSPVVEDMEITQALLEGLHIEDIDGADADNPQLCSEYVKDIYKYMRELELKYTVAPVYMSSQPKINSKMRAILIDWLVQVHLKFKLLQETLYLTISIIDRYLVKCVVAKTELQLVGVTAMLLASKYEEMYAPEVSDFVYITDKSYTAKEILAMEMKMVKELEFSFGNPLPLHFLRRYSRAGEATPEMHTMAKFFIELCLPNYEMLDFKPSVISAGALYLAIKLCGDEQWTPTLRYYSTYSEADILPCVQKLAKLLLTMTTAKQQAVRKKYSEDKFFQVARNPALQGSIVRTLAA